MFSESRYIYLHIFAKTADDEEIITTEILYFSKCKAGMLSPLIICTLLVVFYIVLRISKEK